MRKLTARLMGILVVLLGMAMGAYSDEGKSAAEIYAFEFLFKENCASCHGIDGRGEIMMSRKLKVELEMLDLTRDEIAKRTPWELGNSIRFGQGRMPSFGGKLHDEVIESLALYILNLKQASAIAQGASK